MCIYVYKNEIFCVSLQKEFLLIILSVKIQVRVYPEGSYCYQCADCAEI